MSDATGTLAPSFSQRCNASTRPPLPWQLWVVTIFLGLEGIGNFVTMFEKPIAAYWPAWKALFIVGYFQRWHPVFVLNLIIGAMHVVGFAVSAPFVALINLVLVVLVASTKNYFFASRHESP